MKKILAQSKPYILFSSIIFFIFSLTFFILYRLDHTYAFYDQAVIEIKEDSLVPKSVLIYDASYNDTQVIVEFSDKDLDGIRSGKILAVYTYAGDKEGDFNYFFPLDSGYVFAYYALQNNQSFPSYVLGHGLHPYTIISIISLGFGLIMLGISQIKWRYQAVEVNLEHNENSDEESTLNSDENTNQHNM
ncbi:MAG: hypothetical protein EP317_05660 [Bacillota bacterium]|nr:MAG: hypothetical protein EP317_05660 [Bacillota bacterium]